MQEDEKKEKEYKFKAAPKQTKSAEEQALDAAKQNEKQLKNHLY